ncbi:MAG: C-GCAxxG-C-C family protein [Acutalibacteraceae bacterium]|nr:C-GCAxxG-C-C family protein [Acutalibacteraceae bacterium]
MKHTELAKHYFEQKFHCSQSVLVAFAEELGLSEEQALKLGACFGGGMCKGEVCGACTGALMALGLKYGQTAVDDLESRKKTNDITVRFMELFKKENGSYICKELLGCDLATAEGKQYALDNKLFVEFCPKMVESATRIAEKLLND